MSARNPTKQLAGDLMLVDVSLRQSGRDGKCGVIDLSIVARNTSCQIKLCAEAAKTPLYAANLKVEAKISNIFKKQMNTVHFI